jgi:hypothetical protein
MDGDALRDTLAMEYLRHLLTEEIPLRSEFHEVARDAYRFADAVLGARKIDFARTAA